MNGGVCSSRKHCLCPPGFTGRLCQFPLQRSQQAQAARGNKQPVYSVPLKSDGHKLMEHSGLGRTQLAQTHSFFTLPLSQGGHHSSEVHLRVHHTPDTSVVIHSVDQTEARPPHKTGPLPVPSRHKPKGRCFQETTPKQACNSTPLPVLTNQEDCCGSVGNSWGQNKCYQCPKLPNASVKQTIVEDYGSACPQGYKRYNSTHCQDINECSMQGVCQNGDCLNTLGSFKCSCKSGLVLERNRCVDSPAEQAQCFLMASESKGCEHPLPTQITQEMCCCTVGKAWGRNCERCPQVGTLAFSKICPAGKGYLLQSITETVALPPFFLPPKPPKEEEHAVPANTTPVQQISTSTSGPRVPVVKPTPPTIIRLNPGNDPLETEIKVSPETDECRLSRNICGHGECENSPNGHICHCYPGYHLSPQRNICEDENECELEPCGQGRGRCVNTEGTYKCICSLGFKHKVEHGGLRCKDIDECADVRLCANGRCINTDGSFQCQCYTGYQRTQEGSHCEDIDECKRSSNCLRGRCINNMGSYHCECQRGYMLVGGKECQDIDECASDRSLCQPHGYCENRLGSYVCVCNHGYIPSEDKRSCEVVRVATDEKKECYMNLEDAVFCDSVLATNVTKQECCCSIGMGWGDHCEIYPCPVSHSAEFHMLCPNGQGLYYDEERHYSLPAYLDIDECSLFAEEICKKGRCHNTQPGYECYCQQGFYYDSNLLVCIDVNECHDESLCANGRCVNTEGSFYCLCNPPWIPDTNKKKCVMATVSDVDECQDPSYCKNGRCENTPGSFYCFCDPPLTFSALLKQCVYDDRTAAYKDVCFEEVDKDLICSRPLQSLVVTYSECCCHFGRGWGPECNTCPPRNSEMFNRLCEMHLDTESDGEQDFLAAFVHYKPGDSSEEDSDECSCANGHCVRSYLSTMCKCNPGYRLDHSRARCIDIDECAEPGLRVSPCKNARCVNTSGSYKCFCNHGFVPTRRSNICVRRRTR
ncbi:Latent-transforming growth factor beta-binding protein 3 [Oryzias melastigma]|uniref:Latent-transforming growth factor beta-binding protein 3 n=1 Tax=Oryzias melastigma TaxID=30732 RepID=A0A834FC82_ORYME|nr:Latent-transforming growth factor beta-binding protein 3 [Oryzias melastigma]